MHIHTPYFLLALVFFLPQIAKSQKSLSLSEAIAGDLVKVKSQGLGGYQGKKLSLTVKNIGEEVLTVTVPAGQVFESEDSSVQDLVITKTQTLAIAPKLAKNAHFYTMCTQSKNMAPDKGEKFRMGEIASPDLFKLVQRIDAGNYQNSTAQSAVWAISDKESIAHVYGENTEMVRDLAEVISEEREIDISEFDLRPRFHQISSIKTSLEILLEKDIQQGNLVLVDQAGNIIRQYFENKFFEQGFHQWKGGASHTLGDSAVLFLRLSEGNELVSEKKVLVSDSITTLKNIQVRSTLTYEVKEDLTATIGIFDKDNRLYFLIRKDHPIKRGFHRSQYIAKCLLPPDQDYFVKVLAGTQIVSQEKIQEHASNLSIYPKRIVSGICRLGVKKTIEKTNLTLFDKEGKIVRKLYHFHQLNPGQKNIKYRFEHREGPHALFYLRWINEDGTILKEEVIKSP